MAARWRGGCSSVEIIQSIVHVKIETEVGGGRLAVPIEPVHDLSRPRNGVEIVGTGAVRLKRQISFASALPTVNAPGACCARTRPQRNARTQYWRQAAVLAPVQFCSAALAVKHNNTEIVMKILVAGATGAIGLPLVRALCTLGHEVTGMAHFEGASIVYANLAPRRPVPMRSIRGRCGQRSRRPRRM